jgi:hypothetical protein
MKSFFHTRQFFTLARLSLFVLFALLLIYLPVFIFEWSTNRSVDISLSDIADGSLINLSEKQLFADNYQMVMSSDRALVFSKNDTLFFRHIPIPVNIIIRFTSALHNDEKFRQPVKIDLLFSNTDDSLLFNLLNMVMHNEIDEWKKLNPNSKSPQVNFNEVEKEWPYYLKQNLYFFRYKGNNNPGINSISTNIYSGKLFLMLKYYSVKIYSSMPTGLQPDWFSKVNSL